MGVQSDLVIADIAALAMPVGVAIGVVLCFCHVLEIDPSVRGLADLPPGWHAWRRSVDEPWVREPNADQGYT